MDRVLSAYQVEELIGRGGMGEVYLARDPRLGRVDRERRLAADRGGARPTSPASSPRG